MAQELLPPAVVTLSPTPRLFECAADCPKSHGYVHTIDGQSAPWTLPVRTETPLPCGHSVCVECIAARPALLAECAQCSLQMYRPTKRTRRQAQAAPVQAHSPKRSSPPETTLHRRASPVDAVPDEESAAGLSSVAVAFFQPAPSTINDAYVYEVGESCLLPDDTYVPGSYFEVRVIDRRKGQEGYDTEYLVHFLGWKSRYDKWLGAPALVPLARIVGEGSPRGPALIGRRAACWWRDNKRWFCGHVVAYREPGEGPVSVGGGGACGAVRIRYDDGEAVWEPLPPATRPLQEMTVRLQPSAAEHAMIRLGRNCAAGDDVLQVAEEEPDQPVDAQVQQGGEGVLRGGSDGNSGPDKHAVASADEKDGTEEEWLTTGSRWLGRKIQRSFPGMPAVVGKIVAWLPASGKDPALWRLRHDDGDEEDLEEYELEEGSVAYSRQRG